MDATIHIICVSTILVLQMTLILFSFLILQTTVETDLAEPNYKTTVGPAQFRELVLNRVIQPTVNTGGGRPAKVRWFSLKPVYNIYPLLKSFF